MIRRTPQGLINKSDPGAIQADYVEGLIRDLKVRYPDMDIFLTADSTQVMFNWS
jgi:hypothetical protein